MWGIQGLRNEQNCSFMKLSTSASSLPTTILQFGNGLQGLWGVCGNVGSMQSIQGLRYHHLVVIVMLQIIMNAIVVIRILQREIKEELSKRISSLTTSTLNYGWGYGEVMGYLRGYGGNEDLQGSRRCKSLDQILHSAKNLKILHDKNNIIQLYRKSILYNIANDDSINIRV